MPDDDIIWAQHILDRVRPTRGSYARTNPDYATEVDKRNVRIYLRLRKEEKRREFLQSLPPEEHRAALNALESLQEFKKATAEELAEKRPPDTLNAEVITLNREIADYFTRYPERLHDLTPRKFEEIVAAILRAMGAEVKLTRQSRDGGRDIFAVFKTGVGDLLTIVECKKYRIDRCVGVELVERFMYVVTQKDHASCGLVATTSYFSPEVRALAKEHPFRLKLRDLKGIHEWVIARRQGPTGNRTAAVSAAATCENPARPNKSQTVRLTAWGDFGMIGHACTVRCCGRDCRPRMYGCTFRLLRLAAPELRRRQVGHPVGPSHPGLCTLHWRVTLLRLCYVCYLSKSQKPRGNAFVTLLRCYASTPLRGGNDNLIIFLLLFLGSWNEVEVPIRIGIRLPPPLFQ